MLSDRAMSTRGKGKPVDELDSLCKLYKECVHCAKMEFGPECIPEAVKYNWDVKNGKKTWVHVGSVRFKILAHPKLTLILGLS